MKCKVETATFSESSVKTTLGTARTQLPQGQCGIVFMKIPREWIDSAETQISLERVIHQVMRNTTRISEIVCYERPLFTTEAHAVYPLSFKEYLNEGSPHLAALDGGLIQDRIKIEDRNGWLSFGILTEDLLKQLLNL